MAASRKIVSSHKTSKVNHKSYSRIFPESRGLLQNWKNKDDFIKLEFCLGNTTGLWPTVCVSQFEETRDASEA